MRELLLELEPRCFLPYAHWWHEPSDKPLLIDGKITELEMLDEIADPAICKRSGQLGTELALWQVGDFLQFGDSSHKVIAYPESLA